MQYCRGGKYSKRFSPGSDFTQQGTIRGGFSRGTETGCLKSQELTPLVWYLCIDNVFLCGLEEKKKLHHF